MALKGGYYQRGKRWRSALAGFNALKYLKEIRQDKLMIPEISFGKGLFNYYSVWISNRYPILKQLVKLFPDGDKVEHKSVEKVQQEIPFIPEQKLKHFWLGHMSGENNLREATFLSKYLFETFPDNSIFHRYYTQLLYRSSNFYV